MKLKWIGAGKERTLELPIPFLSRAEKEGEIHFTPEAEVPDELAKRLLEEFAGSFEAVGATRAVEPAAEPDAPAVDAVTEEIELPAVPDSLKRKPGRPRRTPAIPA